MAVEIEKMFSGKLTCIDGIVVDNRAEICINEYYQGDITLYGVSRKNAIKIQDEKSEYLVIELECGKVLSVVELDFRSSTGNESNVFTIRLLGKVLLKSENCYTNTSKFKEIRFQITDGNELIGLCPYDLNENHEDILMYRNINIPIQIKTESVQIKNGLGFSGSSFMRVVKDYLYKGYNCFEKISKTKVGKKNLILNIVNDRNYYTHSSNRISAVMGFDELLNVASLCKELYRVISLKDMGLNCNLIKLRSLHNRKFYSVLKELLEIKIQCNDIYFTEFDGAMRYFSDSK